MLLHGVEPLREEPGRDVLDRIEAEAVHAGRVQIPLAPVRDLAAHLLALEVEVAAHEEGKVALLQRHLVVERLALQEVDRVPLVGPARVEVDGVEVRGAPLERGVPAPAAGEMEVGVGLDVAQVTARAGAVVLGIGRRLHELGRIAARAVIEDRVRVHLEARAVQRPDRGQVLLAGAVLRADSSPSGRTLRGRTCRRRRSPRRSRRRFPCRPGAATPR